MPLVVNINGDKRVIQGFEQAVKIIGTPKPLLDDIGDVLVKEYSANFNEEGKRLDKRWKALKEATIRQRIALGYGAGPILQRTGDLMKGFTKELRRFSVRVHNPVKYFKYHQLGGRNLPQRKMISYPERLKQEIIAQFTAFINSAFKKL